MLAYINNEGDEVFIPSIKVPCYRCDGSGKIVNPVVSVWTEYDRDEDPEGFENMLSGLYDVKCPCCKGSRFVLEPDEDKCSIEELEAYLDHLEAEESYQRMVEAERAMGC